MRSPPRGENRAYKEAIADKIRANKLEDLNYKLRMKNQHLIDSQSHYDLYGNTINEKGFEFDKQYNLQDGKTIATGSKKIRKLKKIIAMQETEIHQLKKTTKYVKIKELMEEIQYLRDQLQKQDNFGNIEVKIDESQ